MPYQVEQLLEGKGPLVWVTKDATVLHALSLMLEHDYSQLPVLEKDQEFDFAAGMVTYEGIIRGIRNFNLNIETLKVRDVMGKAFTCNIDDDLFDILDRLKETNAALVFHSEIPIVTGIITSYDVTEYFRTQTEDLMRVEDIESTIRDLIKEAFTTIKPLGEDDVIDEERLDNAAKSASYGKPKVFNRLTLAEYINLLTLPETWGFYEPIFNLPAEPVRSLLNGIRETRNVLAHFRGDLSTEERDRLKFAVEWISRCQEDYQKSKEGKKKDLLRIKMKHMEEEKSSSIPQELDAISETSAITNEPTDYVVTESTRGGGRYAALADWLQSQPGRVDQIPLAFNEVEKIIGSDLPDSARAFRAWWANDSVGHGHSQLWLDAGWRTTYINLSEERVTFSRIREREKAYIGFFSKLLDDFRKNSKIPVKDQSPDGTSWLVLQTIPRGKSGMGSFVCSFTRDKRFRIELYLDLRDKDLTKSVFDKLYKQKDIFENQLGPIEWERLENRRASRIAIYRDGHITEEYKHDELRSWAVNTFNNFYPAFLEPAEKAVLEAWNG
jgi:CBS domain-containing protein